MSNDFLSDLEHFSGLARLFPLPNLVLFPHVVQPLHIFEPRYRQMTQDALASDRLVAVALLRPGWETDYQSKPAMFPLACLGSIVADQQLPDGRFNLLLRGLARVAIIDEVDDDRLYRQAHVRLLADKDTAKHTEALQLRQRLGGLLARWCAGQEAVLAQLAKLLESEVPLGPLCDILAFALPLEVGFKQHLLELLDVAERARQLVHHLHTNAPQSGAMLPPRFPPAFSAN